MFAQDPGLGDTLWLLLQNLGTLLYLLAGYAVHWLLLIVWVVWWLFGVDWRRAWPALRQGGWAPLVLLVLLTALVWSRLQPAAYEVLGFVDVPNFWSQLGFVGLLVALAFFCGWLQGRLGWAPSEVNLDPPAGPDDHHEHLAPGHDHHGHHRGEGEAIEPISH